MLMMRALGGFLQHSQKLAKHRLALPGRLRARRVLMMLAGWPPGVVHGGPETRHTVGKCCETRACSENPGRAKLAGLLPG